VLFNGRLLYDAVTPNEQWPARRPRPAGWWLAAPESPGRIGDYRKRRLPVDGYYRHKQKKSI
jgi:hypothetical protein